MAQRHTARLARLERRRFVPAGPCPQEECATVHLVYRRGEPVPPIPAEAPRCKLCGEPHVMLIEEVIITNREEAELLKRATNDPQPNGPPGAA